MSAYATFEQLLALYGEKTLLNATPGMTVETLQSRWEFLLLSEVATIDMYVRRQGYILPLDFTDHEPEAALFAKLNIGLALEAGAPALIATAKGVETAADHARTILDAIAAGVRRLPFPIGQEVFASTSRPVRTDEPFIPFDDRLFELVAVI